MKKKISWLILSCLMALSLVLASCAPAAVVEEEAVEEAAEEVVEEIAEEEVAEEEVVEEEVVEEEEVEMVTFTVYKVDGTPVTKTVEKPRYGGVLRYPSLRPIAGFDPIFAMQWQSYQMILTNERLVYGDWMRAAAGTGEMGWLTEDYAAEAVQRKVLCESWEYDAPDTLTYHIRPGIHFWNKPPTNGRELTADDFVYHLRRYWFDDVTSNGYTAAPTSKALSREHITAPDRYTLVVQFHPGQGFALSQSIGYQVIYPHEVIEEYGDMLDWRNVCGTGPFLLTDYIAHSVVTLERNPDYWMKHPLYGDQMPYMDGVKILIIPDVATRIAALRTAKLDYADEIPWEERDAFLRSRPEMTSQEMIKYAVVYALFMRTDDPDQPFHDLKVRKALNMALDREAMVRDLWGGHGFYWGWSTTPIPDDVFIHIPFEDLPEETQAIYTYNPEGARQLLTEAGYPGGFTTKVWTTADVVDELTVVQAYFADIGVELEIKPLEHGTWTSMRRTKPVTYEGMFYNWWWIGDDISMGRITQCETSTNNLSVVCEARYDEYYEAIQNAWPDEEEQFRLFKEISYDIIANAWAVNMPPYFEFNMWWPWLKDYNGEWSLGAMAGAISFAPYIWYDTEMRKAMGY